MLGRRAVQSGELGVDGREDDVSFFSAPTSEPP